MSSQLVWFLALSVAVYSFVVVNSIPESGNGLLYNGTCPNFTQSMRNFTVDTINGEWYVQYANLNVMQYGRTCAFINTTRENGTTYFTKYERLPGSHELAVSNGIIVQDLEAGIVYHYFLHPVPYLFQIQYAGGPMDEVIVIYSCSTCGDYGQQDLGIHIHVVTRSQNPNCTTFEKADELLKPFNLTVKDLPQINQEYCSYP